jgi:FkbH-like protein
MGVETNENEVLGPREAVVDTNTDPTIAIAASFTVLPILEPLRFWLYEVLNAKARIELAAMGQVIQTWLDPKSVFALNSSGLNVTFLRWLDFCGGGAKDCEETLELLISSLSASSSVARVPHLVCLCPSGEMSIDTERVAEFREMDARLKSMAVGVPGISVVTSNELLELYPLQDFADAPGDRLASIPYQTSLFVVLAALIARRLHAVKTPQHKAIVVDCDQTLWAGACGEDGPPGVLIDESRRALQRFLMSQHIAGMLICLCSKNNEEDVLNVFDQRNEMVLKLEQIVAHRLNWESKTTNISSLARELGIGTDSFVFIDDNPLECAEVRASLPEVLTLQLPADPARFVSFLQGVWAFDQRLITREDRNRTVQYLKEHARMQLRRHVASLTEFMVALDLQVRIRPLEERDLARSAQLTQRVNQFNLSSIRRSEAELASHWRSQMLDAWTVEVSDRFGDYGQVGLLLLKNDQSEVLKIDSFLLSCRALGRGVEHQMLASLGTLALERGLTAIELFFIATSKNRPMRDFLQRIIQPAGQNLPSGLYIVPAELAARVRYVPSLVENTLNAAEAKPLSDSHLTSDLAGSFQTLDRNRALVRIAMELAIPNQILLAFELWQRTSRKRSEREYIAPVGDVESTLAGIWAEVLKVDRVGSKDAFFELEGDSLKMVQIIVRVLESFAVELPISFFFDHPTIGHHARKIVELRNSRNQRD